MNPLILDVNAGWIKLHRQLLYKPIWLCSTTEQRVLLITILLMANHTDKQWEWNGKRFTCKAGQFVTSSSNLAKAAGVTRQNVRTALKRFQDYEFLTYDSTKTGILINIVNWGKYQDDTKQTNQDANQQLTNSQPSPNQQLTTNKNIKNDKNIKKDTYTPEFEEWYSLYPRAEAKSESFKNFEKIRKEKGLDFIWTCTSNYINYRNSIPEHERGPAYSSRNFFGQKAYYEDFIHPRVVDKPNYKSGSVVPLGGEIKEWLLS